jgi:CRP-like cAMP-binding protein
MLVELALICTVAISLNQHKCFNTQRESGRGTMKKICEALSSTVLFNGLDHSVFHQYCMKTTVRLVWKGEVIANEGDLCPGIGIIIDGQIALQKYTSSGDFATIELLSAGDIFGEDLMFGTHKTFMNTIEAVSNSKIIMVPRDMLNTMLQQNPVIMENFLTVLSDRVLAQSRRISLLSQKSLRQKISSYLLELLREQREEEAADPQPTRSVVSTQAVELPVSKEVVARLLAMPRPSFSRELITMERDGLIRVSGRVIWLLDIEGLERGMVETLRRDRN